MTRQIDWNEDNLLTSLFNAHRNDIAKISQQHSHFTIVIQKCVCPRIGLKNDAKHRDYAKLCRKCPPGISTSLLLFSWRSFLYRGSLCCASHIFLSVLALGNATAIVTDFPSILGYHTLLLPPTFVDFANACLSMITRQLPYSLRLALAMIIICLAIHDMIAHITRQMHCIVVVSRSKPVE